jgi:P27 family predicted phage terminase small subunit
VAKRGPKPAPTELKLLRGVREDRINPASPAVVEGDPPCPAHLDDVARSKFHELVNDLRANGVLSRTDAASIELYASTYSLWRMARDDLKEAKNLTVEGAMGGTKTNPVLSIVTTTSGLLARLQSEFGLTPSSRSRVSSTSTEPDELETFLIQTKRAK